MGLLSCPCCLCEQLCPAVTSALQWADTRHRAQSGDRRLWSTKYHLPTFCSYGTPFILSCQHSLVSIAFHSKKSVSFRFEIAYRCGKGELPKSTLVYKGIWLDGVKINTCPGSLPRRNVAPLGSPAMLCQLAPAILPHFV